MYCGELEISSHGSVKKSPQSNEEGVEVLEDEVRGSRKRSMMSRGNGYFVENQLRQGNTNTC